MSTFSNGWEQILREGTPAGSAADYTVRIVDDVNADADFWRYCQPLAYANTTACKALVITFPTAIYGDENFFGRTLSPGDNQFSAADYATKIAAAYVSIGVEAVATTDTLTLVDADKDRPKSQAFYIVEAR